MPPTLTMTTDHDAEERKMIYEVTRPLERPPSHPGALLADIIPATGKTKAEIAALLGIS